MMNVVLDLTVNHHFHPTVLMPLRQRKPNGSHHARNSALMLLGKIEVLSTIKVT
jgi:hypothetical protein